MALLPMYRAANNSVPTVLEQEITALATELHVRDGSVLPEGPNILTLGTADDDAELVCYTSKAGNMVTGCVRGYNGTLAQIWTPGTMVYRAYTTADHDTFAENIEALDGGKADKEHAHAQYLTQETDPTVPAWAKAPAKPTYTKSEVGLSNVDNTSDANKPVSSATKAALDGKAPTNHASTGDEYGVATNTMKGHIASSDGTSTTPDVKAVAYQYLTAPASVDLNAYRLHGEWTIFNMSEALNFPPGTWTGTQNASFLKVTRLYVDTIVQQTLYKRGSYEIWIRYCTSATNWSMWVALRTAGQVGAMTSSRILTSSDAGKIFDVSSTAAITITVPNNTTASFPTGTEITFDRAGTGTVTFAPESGATIQSLNGKLSISGQYGTAILRKMGSASIWRLTGDLA